ncbi:hypothetical protein STCU_05802 [Strigomonas culicis]|nr:hypothetical protein STCU_05802 [Strigomonas culicis]|eukprot:EPY27336.1 hypothetical protein STCU_05802 [Strigomonas culicis]
MSPYPWCNFFYRLAYLYRVNGEEGKNMVRALCRCSTPPSGASFVIPREIPVNFRRPYDRMCSFIDTAPLRMLAVFPNLDDLFSVLADLLLEKHIIIVGSNFSVVSTVVMSLQALIAPFDWMHILIPIVPSSLLDVLAAPPPYLVGVLTSQLPLLEKVPIESAIVVRLNSEGVCERVAYINETPSHLPHSGWFSGVRIGLNLLKLQPPAQQSRRDLCNLFLTYYASLFGEVVLRGPKGYIHNKDRMSGASIAFYEMLLTTQSFANLSEYVNRTMEADNNEWVDNEFIVAAVRTNPEVFPRHYQHLISEEKQGGGYVAKHNDCFGSSELDTTALIDGFGGHRLGLTRLAAEFAMSCCARKEDQLVSSDDYYPGQHDWMTSSDVGESRHLSGPVVEAAEEMETVQPAEFDIVHSPVVKSSIKQGRESIKHDGV